jgi:hypothetical protein
LTDKDALRRHPAASVCCSVVQGASKQKVRSSYDDPSFRRAIAVRP